MPVMSRSNHAFMFDGITDSIIVPQGTMSKLGKETSQETKSVENIIGENNQVGSHGGLSGAFNKQLCIEAWVIPDCGGVVAEKEGQFKLKVGDVDTPGPAVFEVYLDSDSGTSVEVLSTATSVTSRGFEGTVYPPADFRGIHDSYNRYDGSSEDATSLNIEHRPLIHVVAAVRANAIELYINGALMAQKSLPNRRVAIAKYDSHLYVGGKGGEFRGIMEALHISANFSEELIERSAPLRNESTLLLYRFEEPIAPITGTYKFSAIANNSTTIDGASVTISQMTISTDDAVELAKKLTGLSTVSGNYIFYKDPNGVHKYSGGDYKVVDYQQSTGTPVIHSISHTPYNLLINAGGIDLDTHKPNGKPPERVRLHNINTSTGTMLVSSIHLDFPNSSNGLRAALHSRTVGVDNHFVVIGSDLLVDSGSGKPYQTPHFSSQIIDRTGQMVIDEGPLAQHGFVYSSRMANTTDDSDNPFAAAWPSTVDTSFQIGHSGRHTLNHVDGHEFLRMLPRANEEIIDQQIDGSADLIDIIYDAGRTGVGEQISVNSRVDVFREQDVFEVTSVVNSSRCEAVFDNGLTKENKELLALGGVNFDYKAFMLKGPVPNNLDNVNAETRRHHLRPSEKSRVAVLHVPALASYDLAPFVKVHYNAIDLTGASMSGVVQPLLMVEKTVPAGSTIVSGSTTVYELIENAITDSSITATLYAPGGYIDARLTGQQLVGNLANPHSLIGDTSEGYESDDELNESLTPINHTPLTPTGITVSGNQNAGGGTTITTTGDTTGNVNIAVDDALYTSDLVFIGIIASIGNDITLDENRATALTDGDEIHVGVSSNITANTTPQIITASHSPSTSHDSVFHRLVVDATHGDKNTTLTDKGEYHRREPTTAIDSPSNGEFDVGPTSSNTHIHEVFDIIDNDIIPQQKEGMRLYIQPSDRRRVNQLAKIRNSLSNPEEANYVSLLYLMSRARVRSVKESDKAGEKFTSVHCVGLSESTANRNVSVRGKGSPDSHVVKEIEPNAPVVTVTLGGPGQGAMDVKPTYDPSPLAHLPFSTRRNCSTLSNQITTTTSTNPDGGTLFVKPLNNLADDLASWGTYGFPKKGRVYLQDGASALYDSKNGTSFVFTDSVNMGDGKFLLANGIEYQKFHEWLEATNVAPGIGNNNTSGVVVSTVLFNDEFFDESSLAEDGTTVNDRMFQSMSDVQHDYQLGTQYASTRALVEIPFFANQFFDDQEKGILPGPDNSFKIHIDATHTAHTYNPTPVGRRYKGVEPADREANSSFTMNKEEKKFTQITRISRIERRTPTGDIKLYPDNIAFFPAPNTSVVDNTCDYNNDPTITMGDTSSIEVGMIVSGTGIPIGATVASITNSTTFELSVATTGGVVSNGTLTFIESTYQNVSGVKKYQKLFLANGEWAYYESVASTYVVIPGNDKWAYSSGFMDSAIEGAAVSTGGPPISENLIPISSDAITPSSDFENRGEYYYDSASVKTQGGNVDYGIRQYVSAVEFKAGPESNPHAPRIKTGRARGVVRDFEDLALLGQDQFTVGSCSYNNDPTITVSSTSYLAVGMVVTGTGIPTGATVASITNSTTFELSAATTGGSLSSQTLTFTDYIYMKQLKVTMDSEAVALFPDLGYDDISQAGKVAHGEFMYMAQTVDSSGNTHNLHYYGKVKTDLSGTSIDDDTLVFAYEGTDANTPSWVTNLRGQEIYLAKRTRNISDSDRGVGESGPSANEMRARTYKPVINSDDEWTITAEANSTTVVLHNAGMTDNGTIDNGRLMDSNTSGLNIKPGDVLYAEVQYAVSTGTQTSAGYSIGDATIGVEGINPNTSLEVGDVLYTVAGYTGATSYSGSRIGIVASINANGNSITVKKEDGNDGIEVNLANDAMLYTGTEIRKIGTVAHELTGYDSGNPYDVTLENNALFTINEANGGCGTGGRLRLGIDTAFAEDRDAILNTTWNYPYAPGGLRNGDTVWANMSMNNPHAIEGLFAKSRGVFNESQVWKGFNGGKGTLATRPRDSIPLENFLIGDSCLETAQNYAQHVNKTVEENYKALGLAATDAPTVAYVDPYLAEDGHARVLLYDVAHDREFVAFQDLHMQVQTNADAVKIGWPRNIVLGLNVGGALTSPLTDIADYNTTLSANGPSWLTTQIDVTNGFPSENPYIRSTQQSKFIESAYAHDTANRISNNLLNPLNSTSLPANIPNNENGSWSPGVYGKAHGHHVHSGYTIYGRANFSYGDSVLPRTNDNTVNPFIANLDHEFSRIKRSVSENFTTSIVKSRTDNGSGYTLRDPSTFFDTPDGTRVIPAFLCLKGNRENSLDLTGHSESRLQHLKQWTDMDFIRRLTVDCGSVAQKDGVVSVESAALEIVRQINQAGAPKGQIVVDKDTTGSAHDPTPWWDTDKAFSTRDQGSHMGYIRAHIGREVQDKNGNIGFTVVIHSTVPGASGRNFCVWLDNSKGQTVYQPEFLIGHGGRWRNFWALPEEKEGENMHPAPMPLNKHGRPFAPVTTLTQYVTPEESGEDVVSTTDFVNYDGDAIFDANDELVFDNPVIAAISNALGGGTQYNTASTESFETEGSSSVLVNGLRVGNQAIGRVNFGGLVASGIPGWAPDAGVWGFGKKGSQKFRGRYGSLTDISYTNHVNSDDLKSDAVGNSSLYGFQLEDHRGGKHGVRFIYRTMGEGFANENTTLPDTIADEVCVFIDDRDVNLGGFTIGKHMNGSGDGSGRFDETNATLLPQSYCGNRWRGVSAPSIAVHCTSTKSGDASSLTIVLEDPFDSADSLAHHDVLGYLGFPLKNGLLQISKPTNGGKSGMTFSYTHRTQSDKSGTHTFFGIKGSQNGDSFSSDYLISPLINWTTIVTDELLAAITTAAINASASDINSQEGLSFDCREMYATDGRTFGEWGVSKDAIKIRAYDHTKPIKPLSNYFHATVHRDMGIQAAHIEFGEVEKTENTSTGWNFGTSRAVADTYIKQHKTIACGYIPNTVLQITTKGKGPNANTATPLLVDSFNNMVKTDEWRRNLKGESFTRFSGDHILPMINNPTAEYDNSTGNSNNWDGTTKELPLSHEMWNFLIPAGEEGNTSRVPSFGEEKTIYMSDKRHIVVESLNGGNSKTRLIWYVNGKSEDWPTSDVDDTLAFSHFGDVKRAIEFNGLRSLGSVFSEPIVYFRGGKGSVDHSVPLFFGGGFSGVTLDINDGTMNDYSTFYTHPYANGPTGTSGIQNANEISTSFALLDCNAMFAFFPGAAFCNQHRGSILPPFFNKDNILSPDLSKTGTTINTGHPNSGSSSPYNHSTSSLRVRVQKPSPLILRFAHPTARYEDHKNSSGTSNVENKTTYIIFGPGQAFPFTQEIADSTDMTGANIEQPHPGAVVTVGNTWSKVPASGTAKLPNHIQNYDGFYMPESSTYQLGRGRFHWRSTINWEPPQGKPNVAILKQGPESGRMYGTHFNADTATSGIDDELDRAHPMRFCSVLGHGVAMAADMVFHMDGGYHPGGHWMDNQITFNPPHPKSNTILQKCGIIDATCDYNNDPTITMDSTANLFVGMGVSGTGIPIGATVSSITDSTTFELSASTTGGSVTNGTLTFTSPQLHSSAYRVAGPITTKVLGYAAAEGDLVGADVDMEYIIVDATRCQNGEELATIMGMAINTYPGAGALKAMGGTHMPSMGNAMRQDRYGWIETVCIGNANGSDPKHNSITVEITGKTTNNAANRDYLEQIPACGWLRTAAGGFAPYYAREIKDSSSLKVIFYRAPNRISGEKKFEDKSTWYNNSTFPTVSASAKIYVWSKAGVHRFNNEVAPTRDHMCQTHFSGIVDAIDRTRPIGVAGWAGERYSYLNSLKVGTEGYSAGLSAWHPMLGFSPYGSASSAMTSYGNLPVVSPMPRSPESLPPIDGIGNNLMTYMDDVYNSSNGFTMESDSIPAYTRKTSDNDAPDTLYTKPPNYSDTVVDNTCDYNNDPTITMDSTSSIEVGMFVSGVGIPLGATVSSITNSTTFELSVATTGGSVTNGSLTFSSKNTLPDFMTHPQGVFGRAFLVVSYECESALIAKYDRDGITALGDWLQVKGAAANSVSNPIHYAGTTRWDDRIHGQDRFIAPANAGPNVEALVHKTPTVPSPDLSATHGADASPFGAEYFLHGAASTNTTLENAIPGLHKTGDMLFDIDHSVGSFFLEDSGVTRNVADDFYEDVDYTQEYDDGSSNFRVNDFWAGDINAYSLYDRSPAKNFTVEQIVWKRMDGGNLSLPAINARGLGAVPWMTRVDSSGNAYTTGEKIFGNVRFSFETTNSAMLPVLQAQEISHPQLASKNPLPIGNVLTIPNEEMQFKEITVIDDSGQEHTIEGGSPFGTIIRGFKKVTDRGNKGMAPALANSGVAPNLKIQLPDPNSIPGNIIVRSGFDRLQGYQNETMGSGGMIHPDLNEDYLGNLFDNSVSGPRKGPTYEDHNWEHIDGLTKESTTAGWKETTDNAPLRTSYEQHDRTLYFHVTKMGHSHTHRYPTVYTHASGLETNNLTASSWNSSTSVLTTNATVDTDIFAAGFGSKEVFGDRRFIRIYNSSTEESVVASYTGISTNTFTGVVGDVDFTDFMESQTITNLKVVPSYYIPAGSNRFFAARRLRDHSEVSGNSPDMAKTQYSTGTYGTINTDTLAYNIYNKAVITPMPLPRMGHHFVTPTMPMLPGHWAHPVYQGLFRKHLAENASLRGSADRNQLKENVSAITQIGDIGAGVSDYLHLQDAEIAFGSLNAAPSGPSDIHGGAFTLMFESKMKYDGYGVLASTGVAGKINQQGGHTIVLEAAGNYTLDDFFPDPARVGAYQIVIQPNTFSNQLIGYHIDGASLSLTGQQVNTVIGRKPATSGASGTGAVALLLAQATQADVRGCEIFINEAMLDINPDHGEQFTNIPPLLLYNPFGVEGTESPSFTRRALPYHPKIFSNSTPGYTLNIPWWSIVHKVAPDDSTSNNFKHLTHHRLDNYYLLKRSTFGSIGVQLTIAGYPSIYPDVYSHILQNTSINPKCILKTIHSAGGGSREITVDNASTFPETPQYGQLLEYTAADGNTHTLAYTRRYGLQTGTINEPMKFTSTTTTGPFWDSITTDLAAGLEVTIKLTHPYNNLSAGKVMTDTKNSIFTMILPQVEKGTRDTTALHIPDAYLCLWHYNLGRPHTFYSDSSRTWGNLTSDRAVDKKPYNSVPEHFETIHYHDSVYAMSLGPFDFRMKSPKSDTKDGVASTGAEIDALSGYEAQGGTNFDSQKIMFSKFWPCGSRGGPLTSRLDLYTQASISWDIPRKYASSDFYFWNDEDGLDENYAQGSSGITFTAMGSGYSSDNRKYPYGWRIAVRQACNKPTWGILTGRGKLEDDASSDTNYTVDYASGPLVQHDAMTWAYAGGDGSQSGVSYTTTYVGVMERQTNFSGMLGCDKPEWQVRYSEGRRMTRPFGTPIRTLLSNSNMNKDWWGEVSGKGIYSLAEASQYYLVDWWGNERGEDVRRAPVRGFGIRPAWDCGDAYEYDRTNDRTPHARIWNYGKPIYEVLTGIGGEIINSSGNLTGNPPLLCGRSNSVNNNDSNTMVDVFAPTHSMRIGDMGNGRGVRYPTQFNEDILTELSEPIHTTGLVLSSNTAEPPAVTGLLRPRNDVLQADEIPRGISARLDISEHGLLKPDAVVSDRVEEISGTSPHKDAVSRTSPRIGIDGQNIESVEKDHIAINTEAHSLHTDRNVGQRTILHGCFTGGSQNIGHLDLTSVSFSAQPPSALRFSHTSNMSYLGGNYILETKSYAVPFDDTNWGYDSLTGALKTTNPYQSIDFNRSNVRNNQTDTSIKWLLRPVRLLDKNHVEMFRTLPATVSGTPQYNNTSSKGTNTPTDYFRASAGGKYGLYTYEVTTPRVAANNFPASNIANSNGPYTPVFYMTSGSSTTTPTSKGPKILGTEVTDFDKTSITSPVTRLIMSENTLQHYRSDAPRRRQIVESNKEIKRLDFSVKPRFSQALHPKGHKGDVTFNTSDHSGDGS